MASQDEYSPLQIKPLKFSSEGYGEANKSIGNYRIIQKVVSSSPNPQYTEHSEVETSLEAFLAPNGECLWRRVAVRSGPSCPKKVIHASFTLPVSANCEPTTTRARTDSLLCWTSFPERPNHKLLCVLVSPSSLSIWDVYPNSEEVYVSGEGHFVTLPFDCCAIHALGGRHGLLLQRKEDHEDRLAFESLRASSWNMNASNLEDDDGFFLKIPPRYVGREAASPAQGGGLISPRMPTSAAPVTSLFSLRHPLDDVLPISLMANETNDSYPSTVVTDVFEKVLFTGKIRWTNHDDGYLDKREFEQTICVTYHTLRKRHAIWMVKEAPPPPPAPPLWQRSRQWRCNRNEDSHLGFLDLDADDMELLGVVDPDKSIYGSTTRDEALADALGVRRTPRKASQGLPAVAAPRGRGIEGRTRHRESTGGTVHNNNTSFSGLPFTHGTLKDAYSVDMDVSTEMNNSTSGAAMPLLNVGPLSNLHPNVAVTCLYEENVQSAQATNVFLASNLEGSGLLLLCLVRPNRRGNEACPNELQLFSFQVTRLEPVEASKGSLGDAPDHVGHSFSVVAHPSSEPCVSAQPVQSTPIAPCFSPHLKNLRNTWDPLATDILILTKNSTGDDHLSLNRAHGSIVDCSVALPVDSCNVTNWGGPTKASIIDVVNPVADRVDIVYLDTMKGEYPVRCKFSLVMDRSALSERSLSAMDSAMFDKAVLESNSKFIEFALKFRADCCRMEQGISKDTENSFMLEDRGWSAVEALFSAVLDFELFGDSVNEEQLTQQQQRQQQQDDDSPWSKLLNSSYHLSYSLDNSDSLLLDLEDNEHFAQQESSVNSIRDEEQTIRKVLVSNGSQAIKTLSTGVLVVPHLFDALHLLYEDLKLSCCTGRSNLLRSVGTALVRTCRAADFFTSGISKELSSSTLFMDHYIRDLGSTWVSKVEERRTGQLYSLPKHASLGQSGLVSSFASPPCFLSWLDKAIKGEQSGSIYDAGDISKINASCSKTRSLLRIFSILFSPGKGTIHDNFSVLERDHNVVSALIEEGFVEPIRVRDELPVGIAIPLLEVLHRCRGNSSLGSKSKWTPLELSLIGRNDLSENTATDNKSGVSMSQHNPAVSPGFCAQTEESSSFFDRDKDGLVPLELFSAMLFPGDNRIREAGRLLRSSRPSFLSVPRAIEVSDHEYERLKQNKLLLLSRRALALPVGRGMLTIGSFQPVAAEPLPVPDLCLVGRVPPANATLALDLTDCPPDMKVWPEFHNGVAAGLRLPSEGGIRATISKITRTWIVYNRPTSNSQTQAQNNTNNSNSSSSSSQGHFHGGLLMALGLRGHLTELEMTDIYEYLTQGSVTTTVGVLLGMAANKKGSCDISVSKMLCLHIPSLIPQHFSAIDVASPVQTAAVAGAGLLFQRSSHRMMTEFLLNEIGKRPESDVNAFDREAYTLSCGIALGMVNLCQGERTDEKGEGGGGEGLTDLRIGERLYRYIVGGIDEDEVRRIRETNDRLNLPLSSASGENERCSCVFEGDSINTDITAPGATLALGLIFMKSGNQTVASAIALPDTHFLLEYVRPDFLALRVISRALILWDDVQPTRQWIENQLPLVVRKAYNQMRATVEKATDLGDMFVSEDAAGSTSIHVDGDGATREEFSVSSEKNSSHHTTRQHQDFDRQAIRQIHVHIVAGACFGIGLRYAGTGNKEAASAIFERVIELQHLRDANDSVSVAMRPEIQILESCLGCAAISLAMVLAGTGDLEALRLFKILRWRCDEQVKYGTHMAYATAIGFLFLGGGRYTLGREPEDIAALVAAFFPRYPSTTTDNQYHLQALRHLYALAVKQREIHFADVDTRESVYVPIEVLYRNRSIKPLRLTAPCILNNSDEETMEIRVMSDRFYPVRLKLSNRTFGRTFFVKKKIASSSMIHDSRTQRSLSVQTGNLRGPAFLDQIKSFTQRMNILAFAQYVCDDISWTTKKSKIRSPVAEFCLQMLYECIMSDTEEALTIYLALRSSISLIEAGSGSTTRFSWDLRLLRSYYEEGHRNDDSFKVRPLLNIETVTYLTELAERLLKSFAPGQVHVIDTSLSNSRRKNTGAALVLFDVPLSSRSALE